MSKAEEVLVGLTTEFVCDCGDRHALPPSGTFRACVCGMRWAFLKPSYPELDQRLLGLFVYDEETGWASWREQFTL